MNRILTKKKARIAMSPGLFDSGMMPLFMYDLQISSNYSAALIDNDWHILYNETAIAEEISYQRDRFQPRPLSSLTVPRLPLLTHRYIHCFHWRANGQCCHRLGVI